MRASASCADEPPCVALCRQAHLSDGIRAEHHIHIGRYDSVESRYDLVLGACDDELSSELPRLALHEVLTQGLELCNVPRSDRRQVPARCVLDAHAGSRLT